MSSRRGILKKGAVGGGLVFGGLVVVGGLASETDQIDDPQNEDQGPDSQEGGSDTSEPNQTWEVLHDERIYTDKRWPHEFEAGTMLHVEFDVIEGGPGSFMFNETEYEGDVEDIRHRIDTEKAISHEIQTSGLTYLEAVPRGEADVIVEVEG